jgi:hypothetical protein
VPDLRQIISGDLKSAGHRTSLTNSELGPLTNSLHVDAGVRLSSLDVDYKKIEMRGELRRQFRFGRPSSWAGAQHAGSCKSHRGDPPGASGPKIGYIVALEKPLMNRRYSRSVPTRCPLQNVRGARGLDPAPVYPWIAAS